MSPPARPFRRLPFAALPQRPARPHRFLELPVEEHLVEGPHGPARLALRRFGQGPPLLLVHGLMTSGYSWRYVLEPLGARHTLLIPDLPGNGDSPPLARGPYDLEVLAALLAALLDALGARGARAAGNSMGGLVAMRLALDHPGAIGSLVNLHSPGPPTARLRALSAALALPGAQALTAWLARRDPERWVWRNVHYRDEGLKSREETRLYGRALASPEGARAFVGYLRDAVGVAGLQRLMAALAARGGVGLPLTLVYATTDPMVPPSAGEALAALMPGVPLRWVEGSSHFLQVDTPERAAELIPGPP